MNKKIEKEDGVTYVINKPTVKADIVYGGLMDAMQRAGVQPDEVMPVLGEVMVHLLSGVAEFMGYEPMSMIRSFGNGIATCEIEFKNKGK